ncbi:MAG: hypothetical protein VX447_13120 [Pseudomonadota bacterium]|nr:hypothetical protein [Pseudomonadota bacterium]
MTRRLLPLLALLALAGCSANKPWIVDLGGTCDVGAKYDIKAPRFDELAQQLAHATGCFIETDLAQTGAVKPNPVKGYMTIRQAVKVAIKGTGLKVVREDKDLIQVAKKPA